MANTDDILSREVAIAANVEETGISLKAKSRAVAAIDRLLGGLADWPAAVVEGKAAKRRLKDEVERKLIEVQAEVAERKLKGMEQAGDALLLGVLKDSGRKQVNVAGVVIDAVKELKALPPPMQPQSDGAEIGPDQLNEDWINQFTRFAEDASSDDLQQIWGRVLAGEISRPGSFSRHTLRFIAELDATTAIHCEFAMENAVGDFIPKTEAWNSSEHLRVGLDLQRLGVLEGLSGLGGMQQQFTMSSTNPKTFIKGGQALVVYGRDGDQVSVPAIVVTRLGQEVFSLLTPIDPNSALRCLSDLLKAQDAVSRIELGSWSPFGDGIQFVHTEMILSRH